MSKFRNLCLAFKASECLAEFGDPPLREFEVQDLEDCGRRTDGTQCCGTQPAKSA